MSASEFEAAAKYVAGAKDMKVTNEDKLDFYKFYKQATVGDCNTQKPGMFQMQQKYMWDAWNGISGMAKEDAKVAYVALLDKLEPGWRSK
ncbi:FERM/acyl-CoA-binding like protein [Babesia gibsoni]|uniref:FERM/acyl-CoA-binding like protein n=1 Tax=Babesia gibsoni TaxID=33632 RepID=A0AAD8UV48_BABGI|nr:FERM/acyl-CoA-binding like protein [Babesia gibsoni]